VTVFAPYVVKKVYGGPPRARISTITLSRQVSYGDLDLATGPGATILVERVRGAARDICRELDRRYPRSVYVPVTREEKCAKRATEDGMMQVNAILSGLKEAGATGSGLGHW